MADMLYRKYRPQVFEDVIGQEPIVRTLRNAIANNKVSHAYLFTGPRGTGKTTMARLVAKALLCEHGPTQTPDGTCEDCRMVAEGMHPDVYELDAASRTGVENVREEIINRVPYAPTRGRYKIYVIDEAHMLSNAAFNALLKTLEEPPDHVIFILCTTDLQQVLPTIQSRCQRFDFKNISPEEMVSRLGAICVAEDVEFEGEALELIAQRAEGGMRNALTSLDQLIAFEGGKVTLEGAESLLGAIDADGIAEIIDAIGKRDIAQCFTWINEYIETGSDLAQFCHDLAQHVRNMYVMSLAGLDIPLDITQTMRRELQKELTLFGPDRLSRLLLVLGDLSAELKTSTNPRLSFEIALTRMCRPDSDLTLESLAERVESLEQGSSACAPVIPGATPTAPSQAPAPVAPGVPSYPQNQAVNPVYPPSTQMPAAVVPQNNVSYANRSNTQTASQPVARPVALPVQPAARPQAQPVNVPTQSRNNMPAAQPVSVQSAPAQSVASPQPVQQQPSAQLAPTTAASRPSNPAIAGQGEIPTEFSNPAALQRVWQETLMLIKKKKTAYGVLFMNTHARFDQNRGVVIEFPPENAFAYKAVQKPDVREALGEALQMAAGRKIAYEVVDMQAAQSARMPSRPQAQPAARPVQPAQPVARPAQPASPVAQPAKPQVPPVQPVARPAQPQVPPVQPSNNAAVQSQVPPVQPASRPAQSQVAPVQAVIPPDNRRDASSVQPVGTMQNNAVNFPTASQGTPSVPQDLPQSNNSVNSVQCDNVNEDGTIDETDFSAILQSSFGDDITFEEI